VDEGRRQGKAYRQENIRSIHENHDQAPNASKVVGVTAGDEDNGDDMVGHHLPVVLAPGLGIKNKDLVEIGGKLEEIVELDRTGKRNMRVVYPHVYGIEDTGWEIVVDVLYQKGE
jgi:hypothetical protein